MAEEGAADLPEPDDTPAEDVRCGSRVVPRQPRFSWLADEPPAPEDSVDLPLAGPARPGGCQTRLSGWAGAHLHGAVRPRRRKAGRGRPPRRWC